MRYEYVRCLKSSVDQQIVRYLGNGLLTLVRYTIHLAVYVAAGTEPARSTQLLSVQQPYNMCSTQHLYC